MSILTRCQVFKSWIVLESTRSINIFQWISAVLARKSNCIIDWIVIYLVANVNLIEQLWLVQKAVNIAERRFLDDQSDHYSRWVHTSKVSRP